MGLTPTGSNKIWLDELRFDYNLICEQDGSTEEEVGNSVGTPVCVGYVLNFCLPTRIVIFGEIRIALGAHRKRQTRSKYRTRQSASTAEDEPFSNSQRDVVNH